MHTPGAGAEQIHQQAGAVLPQKLVFCDAAADDAGPGGTGGNSAVSFSDNRVQNELFTGSNTSKHIQLVFRTRMLNLINLTT